MPLVRFEGFDHLSGNSLSARIKWKTIGGNQSTQPSGFYSADGHYFDIAYSPFNTGFHRWYFEHDFGFGAGKDSVKIGLRITPSVTLSDTDFLTLRYQDSSDSILKELAFNFTSDGKLQCWLSGFKTATESISGSPWPAATASNNQDGTLLFELPAATFALNVSHYWEFGISKSHVTIRRDEVVVYDHAHTTVTNLSHNFTRVGLCYDDLGGVFPGWDDLYLCDSFDDDWLGIVRVTTSFITLVPTLGDITVENLTRHRTQPAYDDFSPYGGMLSERFNFGNGMFDELISYVQIDGGLIGKGIFRFEDMFPVGSILALSLTVGLRNLHAINTATYEGITRLDTTETILSPVVIQPSDAGTTPWAYPWKCLQAIVVGVLDEQPFADQRWTFGFRITAPTDTPIQVTQFVLERLHKPAPAAGARYRGRSD